MFATRSVSILWFLRHTGYVFCRVLRPRSSYTISLDLLCLHITYIPEPSKVQKKMYVWAFYTFGIVGTFPKKVALFQVNLNGFK